MEKQRVWEGSGTFRGSPLNGGLAEMSGPFRAKTGIEIWFNFMEIMHSNNDYGNINQAFTNSLLNNRDSASNGCPVLTPLWAAKPPGFTGVSRNLVWSPEVVFNGFCDPFPSEVSVWSLRIHQLLSHVFHIPFLPIIKRSAVDHLFRGADDMGVRCGPSRSMVSLRYPLDSLPLVFSPAEGAVQADPLSGMASRAGHPCERTASARHPCERTASARHPCERTASAGRTTK
ncbi:unnamed protein product [Oppiella nova]|uniref:Uncharacterized protein n=1 Tax=Oppiella nova TaxID=334625 RepID=A0A7R9QMN4_9ACAR|nr:unnamed protein product [Oppiella nova]CAG2168049.1 unnamed protein product [Oppiella nova]